MSQNKIVEFEDFFDKEDENDVELFLNFCFENNSKSELLIKDIKKLIFSKAKEIWGELSILKLALKGIKLIDKRNIKLTLDYKQINNFVFLFFMVNKLNDEIVRVKMRYDKIEKNED